MAREDRSGEVGLRRKAATLASIIALVALIVGALFGDRGLLHLIDQRHRAEALAREVEELGFVRAGETVFLVRDPGPAAP